MQEEDLNASRSSGGALFRSAIDLRRLRIMLEELGAHEREIRKLKRTMPGQ
jgi:hypothetical protein